MVDPGQQSASVSVQRSVDATAGKDYAWDMMEFAGRFPVVKGRMDFSLGGVIMAFEDDDGLGGMGLDGMPFVITVWLTPIVFPFGG